MRWICRTAIAIAAVALTAAACLADAPAGYEPAMDLLVRGKRFERAAALLESAEKQAPTDYRAPLALGCAYADRAAAIAWADAFTEALEKEIKEAKARQANPPPPDLDDPDPTPPSLPPAPRVFVTKDDNAPFRLTHGEAQARYQALAKQALAAWARAAQRAKADPEKAEAAYVRGWGIALLRRYRDPATLSMGLSGSPVDQAPARSDGDGLPSDHDVTILFVEATRLAPGVAVYWQSLGDALEKLKRADDAKAAFLRAGALDGRNACLWFHLYDTEYARARSDGTSPPDGPSTPEMVRFLQNAAKNDPGNAFCSYLLADAYFREAGVTDNATRGKDGARLTYEALRPAAAALLTDAVTRQADRALNELERGNGFGRYDELEYLPAVPKPLSSAWHYGDLLLFKDTYTHYAILRSAGRGAFTYAKLQAARGNRDAGIRAARAVLGMGDLVSRDAAHDIATLGDPMDQHYLQQVVGYAIASMGWQGMIDVYASTGDEANAQTARDSLAAFRAATAAEKERHMADMPSFDVFGLY